MLQWIEKFSLSSLCVLDTPVVSATVTAKLDGVGQDAGLIEKKTRRQGQGTKHQRNNCILAHAESHSVCE